MPAGAEDVSSQHLRTGSLAWAQRVVLGDQRGVGRWQGSAQEVLAAEHEDPGIDLVSSRDVPRVERGRLALRHRHREAATPQVEEEPLPDPAPAAAVDPLEQVPHVSIEALVELVVQLGDGGGVELLREAHRRPAPGERDRQDGADGERRTHDHGPRPRVPDERPRRPRHRQPHHGGDDPPPPHDVVPDRPGDPGGADDAQPGGEECEGRQPAGAANTPPRRCPPQRRGQQHEQQRWDSAARRRTEEAVVAAGQPRAREPELGPHDAPRRRPPRERLPGSRA